MFRKFELDFYLKESNNIDYDFKEFYKGVF